MINKIILLGDIWKAPLERTTTKGETMCVLYLVTKETQLDNNNLNNDNNKTYIEQKEWHNIVAFGSVAQYILRNIHVGDVVYVEGQPRTRTVGEGANKKYLKDIIINKFSGVIKKIYSKKKSEETITLSNEDDEVEGIKDSLLTQEDEDLLF